MLYENSYDDFHNEVNYLHERPRRDIRKRAKIPISLMNVIFTEGCLFDDNICDIWQYYLVII